MTPCLPMCKAHWAETSPETRDLYHKTAPPPDHRTIFEIPPGHVVAMALAVAEVAWREGKFPEDVAVDHVLRTVEVFRGDFTDADMEAFRGHPLQEDMVPF